MAIDRIKISDFLSTFPAELHFVDPKARADC